MTMNRPYSHDYYIKNRARIRIQQKRYQVTHRKQRTLAHAVWMKNHPEYYAKMLEKRKVDYRIERQKEFKDRGLSMKRKCTHCGKEFDLTRFDSRKSFCSGICSVRYHGRKNYRENRKKSLAYTAQYYRKNRKAIALSKAAWYRANIDRIRAVHNKYRSSHREQYLAYSRKGNEKRRQARLNVSVVV